MEQREEHKKNSLILPILITIIGVAIYFISKMKQNQAFSIYLRARDQHRHNIEDFITYNNTYGSYDNLKILAIIIGIVGLSWLILQPSKMKK